MNFACSLKYEDLKKNEKSEQVGVIFLIRQG
jgi:hypothetical protein